MKRNIQFTTNGILGLLMVVFGLNKFFGFIPVDPPVDRTAQQFMGAMFSSYLFQVVALAEIAGGILLVFPTTRLLGWFVLLPIIFNIVAFHVAHDFIGNGIWLLPTLLFLISGYLQKDQLQTIITLRA